MDSHPSEPSLYMYITKFHKLAHYSPSGCESNTALFQIIVTIFLVLTSQSKSSNMTLPKV